MGPVPPFGAPEETGAYPAADVAQAPVDTPAAAPTNTLDISESSDVPSPAATGRPAALQSNIESEEPQSSAAHKQHASSIGAVVPVLVTVLVTGMLCCSVATMVWG